MVKRHAGAATIGAWRSIDHRIARGLLLPIHRGVYAVGHRRVSREGTWMAAVLAGGAGAVLSHRSAAALWGIRNSTRASIDITGPRRCRQPKIDAHHIALPVDEVTTEAGIPVTNPARTLLDLAAVLTPVQLAHALNEAEIRRLASPLPVDALVARHPGRRGTTALRRALEKPARDRRDDHQEHVRRALPSLPRRPRAPASADERVQLGSRVVRITWRQLHADPDAIAHQLRALLATATAGPRPR